jgi:hypothetical protein
MGLRMCQLLATLCAASSLALVPQVYLTRLAGFAF